MAAPAEPYQGPSKEAILADRRKHIGYNCALNYAKSPLLIVRGEKQWLYDEHGNAYLDCVNNVAHVGHSHPHVVEAVTRQMGQLITNSRYLHPHITEYAKRLTALMPGELKVVFWVNSGSEANDLALRLARAHTGRRGVVCVDGAYHGHTTEVINISPYKYAREGGAGKPRSYVRCVPQPDAFSGPFRGDVADPALGAAYAATVAAAVREFAADEAAEAAWAAAHGRGAAAAAAAATAAKVPTSTASHSVSVSVSASVSHGGAASSPQTPDTCASSETAASGAGAPSDAPASAWAARGVRDDGLSAGCGAFIMESILSCGGQVVPPAGYLKAAYDAVRAGGGVCIADEVQCGFGRVGSHFWAFQAAAGGDETVVPDIVTIGKPLGNGFPVAAVVTTPAIAASFNNGMEYFNTFAGNPVAGAVANAVLDVILNEKLLAHAAAVGDVLLDGFRALAARFSPAAGAGKPGFPVIGSVRGVGLMVGLEMLRGSAAPAADREPDGEAAGEVKYRMLARRILLSTDGMSDNVIKLKPPMCFTAADARRVCVELADVMSDLAQEAEAKAAAAAGQKAA